MIIFKLARDIRSHLAAKKKESGLSIGFIPTMGALHAGHLSLIESSKKENEISVCSIFVNPTQFNDPTDLQKYPRTIEKDIAVLVRSGCDVLFLPDVNEVYPDGMNALKDYDLGELENILEGASRPNHFKGVANVVDRLLQIVQPDRLYLGQKDFQQVKVIERLLKVGGCRVQVVMCPIVREADGLAMSSRNVLLNDEARKRVAEISRTLFWIKENAFDSSMEKLKLQAIERINSIDGAQVDYLSFCNAEKFGMIASWNEAEQIVVVTAVKIAGVRLLDNMIV